MNEYNDLCELAHPSVEDIEAIKGEASTRFDLWPERIRRGIGRVIDRAVTEGKAPEDWRNHAVHIAGLTRGEVPIVWFRTLVAW